MTLLNLSEISLDKAGYLVETKTNNPIFHEEFVNQQLEAEYVVLLAEEIKDKNFKPCAIDNIDKIHNDLKKRLNKDKLVNYLEVPSEPQNEVLNSLVNYALEFDSYLEEKNHVSQINKMMQKFNKINDIEQIGDRFECKFVKLNKIYNISEILKAVTVIINKLH